MDTDRSKPAAHQLASHEAEAARSPFWAFIWLVAAAWLGTMAYLQGGWAKLGTATLALVLTAALVHTIVHLSRTAVRRPLGAVALLLAVATAAWFYVTGSYRAWQTVAWDICGILAGGTFLVVLSERLGKKENVLTRWYRLKSAETRAELGAISYLLSCWLGLTLITLLRSSPLPIDPARFSSLGAKHSIVPAQSAAWGNVRVGLALSGGGYRAAVMHAGTLHALETLGVRVHTLSTVSGGSIIGAYYAIGGDPEAFKNAVAAGRFNLKRELLLAHNALRLPFPVTLPGIHLALFPAIQFDRRDVQAQLLERTLFAQHGSFPIPAADQPALILAATDLTFGLLIGLMHDGVITLTPAPDHEVAAYRGGAVHFSRELRLAQAVAISGAFPLAFPPQPLGLKVAPAGASGRGERPLLLADGGIADNSGVELLVAADKLACGADCATDALAAQYQLAARTASDVFMMSDAGAIFGVEQDIGGLSSVARAFDVAAARAGSRYAGPKEKRPIRFSAQDSYVNSGMQFRMYQDAKQSNGPWHVSFDPRRYPDPVLQAIADVVTELGHPTASEALRKFLAARGDGEAVDLGIWSRELPRILTPADCPVAASRNGLPPRLPGLCEAAELRIAVRDIARKALGTFRTTSTLDDDLSKEQVDALYALGRILVYLRWWQIEEQMTSAAARRAISASPK